MSPSSNTIAGDADLLSEILLYLPAKPLIRFKSVSKQWLSLITSPYFCRRHVRRNSHSVSGILYRRTPSLSNDSDHFNFISSNGKDSSSLSPLKYLKFVEDPGGIKILQSCNGLLCCCSSRVVEDKRNYYIYNPTTNKHLILPRFMDDDRDSTILGVCLAFDPRKSSHYKVICFRSCTLSFSSGCRVEIYSSESRNWRQSGLFVKPFGMIFSNGVFSNGAIHWIDSSGNMIYFDIDKEQLAINSFHIQGIDYSGWGKRYRYLGESCHRLHLLRVEGSRTTQFKVYEMQTDIRNWRVKYVVDLDEIVSANPQMVQLFLDDNNFYHAFSILTIVREEDEDNSSLLLHIPGKVVAYKFKDKTYKIVRDLTLGHTDSKGALQFGCFDAYQYIETLACVS